MWGKWCTGNAISPELSWVMVINVQIKNISLLSSHRQLLVKELKFCMCVVLMAIYSKVYCSTPTVTRGLVYFKFPSDRIVVVLIYCPSKVYISGGTNARPFLMISIMNIYTISISVEFSFLPHYVIFELKVWTWRNIVICCISVKVYMSNILQKN